MVTATKHSQNLIILKVDDIKHYTIASSHEDMFSSFILCFINAF